MVSKQNHPGYETSDADSRIIFYFVSALGIFIVIMMALMAGLYNFLDAQRLDQAKNRSNLTDQGQIPPQPRLQADPAVDMKELLEWESERLNKYGWIDKETGTIQIPIERAIELTAQNGLPARRQPASEEVEK
jgi:hypothetical protein